MPLGDIQMNSSKARPNRDDQTISKSVIIDCDAKDCEAIEDYLNISLLDYKIMELDILLINNNNIKRLFF